MFILWSIDDEVAATQVTHGKEWVANYETKTPPPFRPLWTEDKVDKETFPQRSQEALKIRRRRCTTTGEPITKNTGVGHDKREQSR